MADLIPLSRFKRFIAQAVAEAYNAKALLMQGNDGGLPIVTGDFTLNLTGILVDDLGGVGINEIAQPQVTETPEVRETSKTTQPEESTVTVAAPEKAISESSDQAADTSESEETTAASETGAQNASQSSNEQSTERGEETQTQAYGREVRTTNTET